MNAPKPACESIVPPQPLPDRRPTAIRPHNDRGGIFGGWGPKL